MSVNSKMTALADEVRTLSGATDKLSLDDMATQTHEANSEVDTQADLIEQIKSALQGKVAGGGSNTVENIYDPTQNPVVQGTISSSTGNDGNSSTRLRTEGYIKAKPNTAYRITSNVERIFVIYFAEDKSVVGNSGWQNSPYLFVTASTCEYFRITLSNASNSTITVDDFEWMKIEALEGGGSEDLDADLTEQENLIAELKEVLRGKASVGGNNYTKFRTTTDSSTSFIIENPLGGIARKVSIKAVSPTITSSRKIHECCLDWDARLGAVKAYYSSGNVSYVMEGTEGTPNNGQFRSTDGIITVYRFNSATTWDTTCEYEVDIWQ